MSDPSLSAFVRQLLHRYEQRHGLELDGPALITRFGFAQAKSIEAMLDGRVLRRELGEILAVVADLEGDDEDARLLTSLTLPMVEPADEPGVMSGRLVRRIENMERFLRRIGKLDEFRRWVAGGDKVAEG